MLFSGWKVQKNFFSIFSISMVHLNPGTVESLDTQKYFAIAGFSAILQVEWLKSKDLIVRNFSANTGFSTIMQFAILILGQTQFLILHWLNYLYINQLVPCNFPTSIKELVPEVQKIAEISVVDGVCNFAPKIITKKTEYLTRILQLW